MVFSAAPKVLLVAIAVYAYGVRRCITIQEDTMYNYVPFL